MGDTFSGIRQPGTNSGDFDTAKVKGWDGPTTLGFLNSGAYYSDAAYFDQEDLNNMEFVNTTITDDDDMPEKADLKKRAFLCLIDGLK